MKVLIMAVCAVLACGCSAKRGQGGEAVVAKPSRAASAGCEWTTLEAKAAGISLLVEKCQQARYSFEATAAGVSMKSLPDGALVPIVTVLSKRMIQPVRGAIRDQFVNGLSDKQRMGCSVEPVKRAEIEGVEQLEIRPAGSYVREADELRVRDAAFRPCGEYGEGDGVIFYVSQPEVTRTRFAMVHARREGGPWDELSVRFLKDDVADAALQGVPVTNLAVAERLAGAMEAKIDGYQKKTGQTVVGDTNATWTAFLENGKPVMIVEVQDAGDAGSGSLRYFFRDGKLFFHRQSLLRPQARTAQTKGGHGAMDSWLVAMAFGGNGKLLEGRLSVNGQAVDVREADVTDAQARANALVKRAMEAK